MSERKTIFKKFKEFIETKILPFPSYLFIVFLRLTLKVKFSGMENIEGFGFNKKNYILAFWHGNLLLMVYAFRGDKKTFLVSYHRDGELITKVIKRFGIEATRGSTTRGGLKAMLMLLRKARAGFSIAFTPDGPKGPLRKVQNGIIELARLSKLPIIPVGFYAKKFKELNSWDSFKIPYPFTKVAFHYEKPILVEGNIKNYNLIIEEALNRAEEVAKSVVLGD